MCEYCGCQSLESIAELTREHDRVVNLIAQIRAAHQQHDLASMLALCRQIATVLEPHTVVEEHGLFPAMAPDFPEKIAILEAEHRRIEAVLADPTALDDPEWPARLIEVLAMLREHILKEQDGVFPAALSTLSNEQWDRLRELREAQNASQPASALATHADEAKARSSFA